MSDAQRVKVKAKISKWRDGPTDYGLVSRFLHWLTFILLLISFGLAWTWALPGRGPLQNTMVETHRSVGIVILLLTIIRLLRHFGGRPATLSEFSTSLRIFARSVQAIMLTLLLLIPLVGWAYTNAGGFDVAIFRFILPHLVSKDSYFVELLAQMHELLAYAFLAILSLHIAGAVRHWAQGAAASKG